MNEKETGSFYTPQKLIEYMINYVSSRVDPKSILEPSAGDGRFANHLNKFNAPISLIEFDKSKTESLQETYGKHCNIVCDDFIKYSLCHDEKYDLIIGNPPYIAKKNIPENQFSEFEKNRLLRGFLWNEQINVQCAIQKHHILPITTE